MHSANHGQQPKILEDTTITTLSVKEASEATGYHTSYISKLILEKKLPASKDDRNRWQIRTTDLDKYMQSGNVKPRRAREYTKHDENSAKPKTLVTQLDEAKAEIEHLKSEIEKNNKQYKNSMALRDADIKNLKIEKSEWEQESNHLSARNEELKTETTELRAMLMEQSKDMQEFMKDVIKSVIGSPAR